MLIYHYNNEGKYICSSEARESPEEPGVFLVPAQATKTAPPPDMLSAYHFYFFDGAVWNAKADYRGQDGCEIDADGYFIAKHTFSLGEELSSTLILAEIPDTSLIKPKWNGTAWQEGATADEITAAKNSAASYISLDDRLKLMQSAIDSIVMGG